MNIKSALRAPAAAALVFSGLALTGCATMAFTAPIHSQAEQLPAGDKLPLRVGLLISEQTLGFQTHAHIPMGEWVYPFGKDLPEVARQTLSQVFDSVTLVQSPDFQSYDLIVEPTFDEAATHVDISMSSIHVVVAMNFTASNASGVKWRKSVVGELTTPGSNESFQTHGQAVSKAVSAAAVAMRAELASARPRADAPSSAAAPAAAWWAK